MSNPNPVPPPAEHRFTADRQPASNGRTPTKWMRDRLSRAAKSGDRTEREAIYEHLLEVATSWEVVVIGRGGGGELLKVASARDSVAAAKLLFEYDMGKPTGLVEISNPDGTLAGVQTKTTSELRQAIAKALGIPKESQAAPGDQANAPTAGAERPSGTE
jgi:hypothetical protein